MTERVARGYFLNIFSHVFVRAQQGSFLGMVLRDHPNLTFVAVIDGVTALFHNSMGFFVKTSFEIWHLSVVLESFELDIAYFM
jgi:hypothetical protein